MRLSTKGLAAVIITGCFIANCLTILIRSI